MEMGNAVFALIFVLLLLAGSIWLQIFLSTKNNKWLGLIIPLICLIIAVSGVLGLTMYTTSSGITTVTETVNGDVIREEPIAGRIRRTEHTFDACNSNTNFSHVQYSYVRFFGNLLCL